MELDGTFGEWGNLEIENGQGILKTSAPIGAWKCNYPPYKEIMTDRNETTN